MQKKHLRTHKLTHTRTHTRTHTHTHTHLHTHTYTHTHTLTHTLTHTHKHTTQTSIVSYLGFTSNDLGRRAMTTNQHAHRHIYRAFLYNFRFQLDLIRAVFAL